MKRAVIAIALALAVVALNVLAQDAGGPPPAGDASDGGPGGGPGRGPGGIHLLPPRAQERLKLTDDQQKQVADLEAEVKAKLEKILTPEQMEQLKQMRPPHPQGGPGGGPGGAGPDAGAPGGGPNSGGPGGSEGQPKRQRPASE